MSLTNVALNSRSLNGIITISDGTAVLENGDLTCEDINSANLSADNINTNLLNVTGKLECNSAGPYNIPTSISSVTGLLIGYGHVTNSGATDFLNYQSTYTSTQGGFRFWNKSNTQTLTNLAIIDNTQTYFSSQLTGCLAENPVNPTSVVNKTYVDSNFLDITNNLTQSVNGLKTFSNNTNFTGSLLSRTNIKLSEYENTASTNTITLTFPMSETIALRTTPSTANPMTINLPLLTNNERGYVFTFNKLFDTANATNRNFPVTFNTSGGQAIYSLYNQSGTPTTNTTLLSVEKIQCKLAVGWFGSLLYWIEQTDFSTYDRYKLTEWGNATTTNTLTLTLPLPPTIALRTSTESTMTINLPALTTLERGQIFTFVKLNTYNYDVIFNTSSGQWIFPLNNITGGPTTNSTIFPSNKKLTKLAVGWFGNFTYWIEVSDYSTFDVEQNNLIYARLASPNAFTNTNTFNSFLPTSTQTPSSDTQLITKIYADTNFLDRANNLTQNVNGLKTFTNNTFFTPSGSPTSPMFEISTLGAIIRYSLILNDGNGSFFSELYNNGIVCHINNKNTSGTINFTTKDGGGNPTNPLIISSASTTIYSNFVSNAQATFDNFTPTCSVSSPSANNHLTRKDYVDNNFVDKTTDQTITGTKRFLLIFSREYSWNDAQTPFTGRIQAYLSGTNLGFISVNVNNNSYTFYTKDVTGTIQTSPLIISSANTTVANNLVSNNLTSPSVTGTNNIYTNLSLDGGIINIGARASNINIKCTLNINESVYGTSQNSIINMESNSLRFNNTGSTNGNYIFTISEGTVYNPLVINKTSINLNGDATVSGNLILYDTTPSTKNVIIGMVGNDLFFTPSINAPSSSYNFKVNDSASTLTTPLIINSTNTTIANNLISNSQATFNNICPVSNTNATLSNHLTRKDYVDNNFVDKTNTQTGIAGDKTFTGRLTNTFVIFAKDLSWSDAQGSGGRVQAYLSATDLGFISVNVNNNSYTFNTKDGAGNPTNPLIISSASTTISNNLVSNNLTSLTSTSTNNIYTSLGSGGSINIGGALGTNNIYGSTTFNSSSTFNVGVSFLGISTFNNGGTFTEIEQTSGSNLVIRNTTNSKKIILSTTSASTGQVDSLVINTTSCDILSPTLNLNSASTINIQTPNNLTGIINFLNTLTTATINFCSTTYTSIFNLNARLAHKQVQYMNEVKTISGTSPPALAFPLEQSWMFTSTGATQVVITLPEIVGSHQAGFNFIIFKTASNTNSVLFNRSGSNTIRGLNSITDLTSITRLSGTNSVGVGFYTAEVSTGNFAWISY